jgi:exodeoxyribonuclease V alpha subunit
LEYLFTGHWEHDPSWGKQFRINRYQEIYPHNIREIERYLKNQFYGVGISKAKMLTDQYGTETLTVLKNDPQKVISDLPKFPKEKILEMSQAISSRERRINLEMGLKNLFGDITISESVKAEIIRNYGDEAIKKLKENPWKLTNFRGVAYPTATAVAQRIGFDMNSPEAAIAGISEALKMKAKDGHTALKRSIIRGETRILTSIDKTVINEAIDGLLDTGALVEAHGLIGRKKMVEAERNIAKRIINLCGVCYAN